MSSLWAGLTLSHSGEKLAATTVSITIKAGGQYGTTVEWTTSPDGAERLAQHLYALAQQARQHADLAEEPLRNRAPEDGR